MWKKNIYKIFVFTFILFSSLGLTNIFNNPYTTTHLDNLYSQEPNQNFLKVKFILENSDKYDSFLFGSSRVGKINPKLFTNGKFYNMTYSEGLPYEHLLNIKLFLKHHIKIKNIYIGLDDFSYEVDPVIHDQQVMRKPHYLASGESFLDFYSLYHNVSYMYLLDRRGATFDIDDTGMPLVPIEIDNNIEKNKIKYCSEKKFLEPCHYSGDRIVQTLQELKEIKTICKINKINLVFFINPIHKTTYLDTNFDNFLKFKKQLVRISEFIDFSGLNNITTNNYFYYETSHYRGITGTLIAKIINGELNENFGKHVTPENIEAHLEKLRNDRIKWQDAHPLDVAEIRALKK